MFLFLLQQVFEDGSAQHDMTALFAARFNHRAVGCLTQTPVEQSPEINLINHGRTPSAKRVRYTYAMAPHWLIPNPKIHVEANCATTLVARTKKIMSQVGLFDCYAR